MSGSRSRISRVVLVQPPFVQLNAPYPSPYYLKSFLETNYRGENAVRVTTLDHSIGLFERIFCRCGLEQIFDEAERSTAARPAAAHITRIIECFLSEKKLWLASIDRLVAFLRGKDPEWGHLLALANGCLPGGPRADAFIEARGGEVSPDDAKLLAARLIADMADFITGTVDSGFSLIRYTPVVKDSFGPSYRDFAALKKKLDGYIMNAFYRPLLNEEWGKLESDAAFSGGVGGESGSPFLLGLTIPFPGCLAGALVCAESVKHRFGSAVRTAAGGGYVNTELRSLDTPEFSDYFDHVSLDKGYANLLSILEHPGSDEEKAALEDAAVRTVFPDYSGVDFSRYLYPVDDANPMHRLWSDGHWLKAYLAHGCYWHFCAFCDVTLDYIKHFAPVDTPALFAHMKNQAEKTGIRGLHLVDEAAPAASLVEFSLLNRDAALPLNFWGNIRFERDFTADTAAILASGGLTGVSAGLEVATERGFKRLGKGITLESAVRTCAAFKEAGILTHAYLIFGYWDEDEQEIIDSAEILRQLFSLNLLDSGFWHKFMLTYHSRIYAEKRRGLHPELKIIDDPAALLDGAPGKQKPGTIFALNDLSFEGEERFDKYTEPLDRLLATWMSGDTETPVTRAFPFKVKPPSIPPDRVAGFLDKYARDRDTEQSKSAADIAPDRNVLFLGSIPRLAARRGGQCLRWRWKLAERELALEADTATGGAEAGKLVSLLESVSGGRGLPVAEFFTSLREITGEGRAREIWTLLRESGLAVYPRLRNPEHL
ncbi:MAG: radical SAM protein [Treponema sp.]|nr:radical SAM protein [Treponema sp.]